MVDAGAKAAAPAIKEATIAVFMVLFYDSKGRE
jgi:hypothetical protein